MEKSKWCTSIRHLQIGYCTTWDLSTNSCCTLFFFCKSTNVHSAYQIYSNGTCHFLRKKNHRQHRQTESSPVSPADVVIGKPCETKTDMAKQVNEEENQVLQSHLMIFLRCVSEYRGCEWKSIILGLFPTSERK